MITEELGFPEKKACIQCIAIIDADCKYCNSCGAKQYTSVNLPDTNDWLLLKQAALFYGISIIICSFGNFIEYFKTFNWLLLFEILLAGVSVGFFIYNWKENKPLLIWRNFSWQKLSAYAGIAMACSFLVHYAVTWLNVTIFSKEETFYEFYRSSYYAGFLLVLFNAVIPALFEEIGFRGYLLQNLLKVADKEQAIYISAFLFAIIHMSFVSLFWLIPFALFIGYVRVKENTLWYGIFFHFFFNLTACLFQLL